jgi:hypothetical protein
MLLMTERKRASKQGEGKRRKPPQRSGKPLNVWLEADVRDALDALLVQTRRSLTSEVSIALENHLKAAGLWPPPSSAPDKPQQ